VRVPEFGAITVTVFLRNGRYMVYLAAGKNGNRCHQGDFETQAEALNCAFELVEVLASD
jgi:hypothetical protein